MRIIPAIDIIDSKCVRLSQGDYNKKKVYRDSPLEVAKEFEAAGIRYLHLVDLDGAASRKIVNYKVLEEICSQTNLIVDFGGGVKSEEDIEIAFKSGAAKITAGSVSVTNPEMVEKWIESYGAEKIILGADVQDMQIMINGWKTRTEFEIVEFLKKYESLGIQEIISTDIGVDGMLSGPAIGLYSVLMSLFPNLKFVASGGVAQITDLDDLKVIGVDGVIIGKAIYENKITLKQLEAYVD